ncbi:unnamed protein product [Rotaria socialis]|uniref:Uncharacterized protein n=1 Tax=Rotaria socialis TaxID=392032 RepID=A0A820ULS4_9BILA|nr:unnamed protein product [Rotaria socialis]
MVSIPRLVTGQLLMLGDNTTNFEVQKITEISFRSDWWEHNPGTGANLVWMLQIELYRSLATNNRTGIEQGFTRMWQDIVVSPLGGQGIQNDWSYHFQRTQLLSGDAWMITNDRWDWQSIGRAIDRPDNLKMNLFSFADRIENKPDAVLLIGNKHFYTSDYQVHRRANWTTAIKMQSI